MKSSGPPSADTIRNNMAQKAKRFVMNDGKLDFVGEVKRPPKFAVDPTVDHIMSNLPGSEGQQEVETGGMVTLRIPSDPNDPQGNRPLDINLNGQNYSLPRDVTAKVPKEIADIVLNAQSSISVVPAARGEKVICQVDPQTGQYLPGQGPTQIENRRFNVVVEDTE